MPAFPAFSIAETAQTITGASFSCFFDDFFAQNLTGASFSSFLMIFCRKEASAAMIPFEQFGIELESLRGHLKRLGKNMWFIAFRNESKNGEVFETQK